MGSGERNEILKERRGANPLLPASCPLGKSVLVRIYGSTSGSQALFWCRFDPTSATRQAGWCLREQAWSLARLFDPG